MAVSITITGLKELESRLGTARVKAVVAMGSAIYAEANRIFNASQVLTPVDTGALRGSGHVTPPAITGTSVETTIGYGGPAAPYAIYVHEITTSFHNPPTQAKFLEQPFLAAAAGLSERLGATVQTELRL